jgi:hypothetical protein
MGYRYPWSWYALITAALVYAMPAAASELTDWQFDSATAELEFALPEGILPEFFLLAEPARLVLDLPQTQLGTVEREQTYAGAVERIRLSQFSDDVVRIVMDLAPGTRLDPEQVDLQFDDRGGQRWWRLRPLIADSEASPARNSASEIPPLAAATSPTAASLQLPPSESAAETLPLDPYLPDPSASIVSVPSLAAEPVAPVIPAPVGLADPSLAPLPTAADNPPAPFLEMAAEAQPGEMPELAATALPPEPQAATTGMTPAAASVTPMPPAAQPDTAAPRTAAAAAADPAAVALVDGTAEAAAPSTPPAAMAAAPQAAPTASSRWPAPIPFGQPLPARAPQ